MNNTGVVECDSFHIFSQIPQTMLIGQGHVVSFRCCQQPFKALKIFCDCNGSSFSDFQLFNEEAGHTGGSQNKSTR